MDCIFCKIVKNEIPSYTIYENEHVKCFLDINPLGDGHTVIIPKHHYKDLKDIPEEELYEIVKASKYVYNLLDSKLNPLGIRIVQNNGCYQEIKHYHMHLIPKYNNNELTDIEEVYNKIKGTN